MAATTKSPARMLPWMAYPVSSGPVTPPPGRRACPVWLPRRRRRGRRGPLGGRRVRRPPRAAAGGRPTRSRPRRGGRARVPCRRRSRRPAWPPPRLRPRPPVRRRPRPGTWRRRRRPRLTVGGSRHDGGRHVPNLAGHDGGVPRRGEAGRASLRPSLPRSRRCVDTNRIHIGLPSTPVEVGGWRGVAATRVPGCRAPPEVRLRARHRRPGQRCLDAVVDALLPPPDVAVARAARAGDDDREHGRDPRRPADRLAGRPASARGR